MLTLLGVLGAGAVALGLRMSPSSAVLTVQNATAATFGYPLGSQSFTLDLTSSVSSGKGTGTISQERTIDYRSPGHMVVYRAGPPVKLLGTLGADAITSVLTGYAAVTAGTTPWIRHGSHFARTESLVAFSARVSHIRSAEGKVYETAVVRDGYLVLVNLHVIVLGQTRVNGRITPGGIIGETFDLVRIGAGPAPAVNS